ncbi:hypothetical protein TSUD_160460 [Trifolium subterraneum]|uniref:Uncharacterized protein n=1 Tax=Trifolium subterraneum TaxID=3900 RepID=A0A2Z6NHI8_TRISU|nr:hypothetical protein TSUD_160460 [Trifolium subterraneum]
MVLRQVAFGSPHHHTSFSLTAQLWYGGVGGGSRGVTLHGSFLCGSPPSLLFSSGKADDTSLTRSKVLHRVFLRKLSGGVSVSVLAIRFT